MIPARWSNATTSPPQQKCPGRRRRRRPTNTTTLTFNPPNLVWLSQAKGGKTTLFCRFPFLKKERENFEAWEQVSLSLTKLFSLSLSALLFPFGSGFVSVLVLLALSRLRIAGVTPRPVGMARVAEGVVGREGWKPPHPPGLWQVKEWFCCELERFRGGRNWMKFMKSCEIIIASWVLTFRLALMVGILQGLFLLIFFLTRPP